MGKKENKVPGYISKVSSDVTNFTPPTLSFTLLS